ncbi:hypothetical protein V5O48_007011, partial [Marasmius crinis-equi]
DAVNLASRHYPLAQDRCIAALLTTDLNVCKGKMLEITEEAWDLVKDDIARLYFKSDWRYDEM